MNTNTVCVGSFNSSCSGFLQLKNDGHASRPKEKVVLFPLWLPYHMGLALSWRILLPPLFNLADISWDEPPRVAWGVCWLNCCYLITWHHSFLSGLGIRFLFLFHGFNFQILDLVFLEDTRKYFIGFFFFFFWLKTESSR